MNRLQKKCLFAAAGTHLLIVVALLCSGFIMPDHKVENTDLLNVIPANVVENALNQGVSANLPPPTPPQPVQPVTPTPPPPTPTPTPTPPDPTPEPPTPKPAPVVKAEETPPPMDPVVKDPEVPKPPKPKPEHKIKVDLTAVKRDNTQAIKEAKEAQEKAQKEAERQAALEAKQRADAFKHVMRNISRNSSSATAIELPTGNSSAAVANYASVVRSIYENAWLTPDDADNDDAVVKVSVTIGRDGRVITSRILNPSGDSKLDRSIQRTLDRVTFVREFPESMKQSEVTFVINFNLKAKRLLG
ncbi:MAG TPA: cell envelope integrity protein TolA [Verrucomicrobiae bacterium]